MPNNFYFNLLFDVTRVLGSAEPQTGSTVLFLFILYFKDGNLLRPLAPLWVEIDICYCRLFCTKFNAKQLLFQSFFYVMRIFGSVEPQTESTLPFLYLIIFQRWESFVSESIVNSNGAHRKSVNKTILPPAKLKNFHFKMFIEII